MKNILPNIISADGSPGRITSCVSYAIFFLLVCLHPTLSAQNSHSPIYCASRGLSTLHGYINKVSMEAINNTSGNNNGYGNFTNLSTRLQKSADYNIELYPGFVNTPGGGAYVEYWSVYIDFNQDGLFEPTELVAHGDAAIRIIKSFRIPPGALTGPTHMRIQMQPGTEQTNPCADYAYGEVEDYTVDIVTSISADAVTRKESIIESADEAGKTVQLFPNPAKGSVILRSESFTGGALQVNIYNQLGQKISGEKISGSETSGFVVNISKLRPGIYIVEAINNKMTERRQLLVLP